MAAVQELTTVATGQVRGVSDGDVTAFKGIPYAAPPVGSLRWRPPQPAAAWVGVRPASSYGADFMQLPFPPDEAPLRTASAEDGLFINVWRPAAHRPAALPVLVWIHGGGFVNGGTSPAVYDGSACARAGVVFVSFNYRLGRFGFFAFPALSAEGAGGGLGNYAYMDQIAALRWIQTNIAAFGGDPDNVTLVGESAGGASIHALVTSPLTHGLFHKAIIQSGGGRTSFFGLPPLPQAEQAGLAFARAHGVHGSGAAALQALRELPAGRVVGGLNMTSLQENLGTFTGPILDGQLIVGEPQAIYTAGRHHAVPMLVGANSHDLSLLHATTAEDLYRRFGTQAAAARRAYDPAGSANVQELARAVGADALMLEPARFVAQELSRQGQPVWEYRFSYVAAGMRALWPGAVHASEIPYAFDTVPARYGDALTAADAAMARTVNAYWVNFARSGDPNGPGLPPWPRYGSASDLLMNFSAAGARAQADPWKARLDLHAGLSAVTSSTTPVSSGQS